MSPSREFRPQQGAPARNAESQGGHFVIVVCTTSSATWVISATLGGGRADICDLCAAVVTAQSLVLGFVSLCLVYPLALIRTLIFVVGNLWNAFQGARPVEPLAFIWSQDLVDGRITAAVAQQIAAWVGGLLDKEQFSPRAIYAGAVAIECGFTEAAFVRRIAEAMGACPERKQVRALFPLADKWEGTILGGVPQPGGDLPQ